MPVPLNGAMPPADLSCRMCVVSGRLQQLVMTRPFLSARRPTVLNSPMPIVRSARSLTRVAGGSGRTVSVATVLVTAPQRLLATN